MKNSQIKILKDQVSELETMVNNQAKEYQKLYSQVNSLLLWKTALKVKVNSACPTTEYVGKEGYIGDVFPNGFTVWVPEENLFLRMDAIYLDVVEWDQAKFLESMKTLGYQQINGRWIHQDSEK